MDLSPWLILRQASEAVANGRPDDAHRLLAPLVDEGNRKAQRAAREVVKAYCTRAAKQLDQDQPDAAWWDLLAAESLNTGEKCVAELRLTLTRLGLVQARGALEIGDPAAATTVTSRLRERGVRHPDLPRIEEVARDWLAAAGKADRGDFLPAIDDLHRLRAKLPCPPTGLERYRNEIAARHERFLDAVGRAQEATGMRRWRDAVVAADEALSAAPEYHVARSLRTKAWQAAYPDTSEYRSRQPTAPPAASTDVDPFATTQEVADRPAESPASPGPDLTASHPPSGGSKLTVRSPRPEARDEGGGARGSFDTQRSAERRGRSDRAEGGNGAMPGLQATELGSSLGSDRSALPKRFLLWVDGVAGFLVCTGTRVTFGQAVLEGGPVDIPLFADVSRVHAELTRDGEGFLVEAGKAVPVNGKDFTRTVQVNGKEVSRSVLTANDRVTLGATCQFVFHRPVLASSTAKLEITSGHRLMLPVEGVLLMANEVILGPDPQSHIVVRDAPGRILLYRSKDGLSVRFQGGKFLVNDQPFVERALLPLPGSFEAGSLTFTVEAVGPRA